MSLKLMVLPRTTNKQYCILTNILSARIFGTHFARLQFVQCFYQAVRLIDQHSPMQDVLQQNIIIYVSHDS